MDDNTFLDQQNWQTVDVLRMDIEDSEKEVLDTANKWIVKLRLLIVELHPAIHPNCAVSSFKALADRDARL